MIFTKPFPTPDEFETVWQVKKLERENKEDHRKAKATMRQLASRLRQGYPSLKTRYWLSDNAVEIIEKQLAALGWSAKWTYDRDIVVSRPLAEERS